MATPGASVRDDIPIPQKAGVLGGVAAKEATAALCRQRLGFEPPRYRLPYEQMQLDAGVGLIGLHWVMLTMHLPAYRAARFNVRASAEINPERIAEARAADFPIGDALPDWRDVVTRDDVKVIDCCFGWRPSRVEARREVLAACCEAGKDLMIHKPPARRLVDALAFAETAKRAGIRLAVNQNARYNPANFAVKQLLTPERLGRPMTIELQSYWRSDVPGPELWSKPATIGHTTHHADLIRWWAGAPCVAVTARATARSTLAIYEFANGTLAYHMENHAGVQSHRVVSNIMAEGGVVRHGHNWNWHLPSSAEHDFVHVWRDTRQEPVRFDLPEHVYEPSWSLHNPFLPRRGPYYDLAAPVAGMMGTLGSLLDASAAGYSPDNAIDVSIESFRMCLAAQVSARTGESVNPAELDPNTIAEG